MTGAEIKALLANLGISTRQLAAKLDVPPPVVLAWQKEELYPTKRHVEAMRALENRAAQESRPILAEGAAAVPVELSDPAFWKLIRKLIAYPTLRDEVEKTAASYRDPAENTEEPK